jgi:uncharacterized damage-inducible protein DinB
MDNTRTLRENLVSFMEGEHAHTDLASTLKDFPLDRINKKVPNLAHTAWHLLYHLRVAQWDILEFIKNPHHVSPDFPSGYWPDPEKPADTRKWHETFKAFYEDLESMKKLITDEHKDLFEPIPHGSGQTTLREALLIIDHNSYHIGQMNILRKLV